MKQGVEVNTQTIIKIEGPADPIIPDVHIKIESAQNGYIVREENYDPSCHPESPYVFNEHQDLFNFLYRIFTIRNHTVSDSSSREG